MNIPGCLVSMTEEKEGGWADLEVQCDSCGPDPGEGTPGEGVWGEARKDPGSAAFRIRPCGQHYRCHDYLAGRGGGGGSPSPHVLNL